MRERAEVLVRIRPRSWLESRRDELVEASRARRAERIDERVANERMSKRVASRRPLDLDDQSRPQRHIECVHRGVERHASHLRRDIEVELGPDHGARAEQRPGRWTESRHARSHHLPDPFGDRELARCEVARAGLLQVADQLLDEERVAARPLTQAVD